MYLHSTHEAQILYYIWFKPIGGLHGLKMTFCIELSLQSPLTIHEKCITIVGHTIFLVHFIMLWPINVELTWVQDLGSSPKCS